MFIVRFVRKDGKPDEEYYYHTLQKAEAHSTSLMTMIPTFMSV